MYILVSQYEFFAAALVTKPSLLQTSVTVIGHSFWCHKNDRKTLLWRATLRANVLAKVTITVYWSPSPDMRSMIWLVSPLLLHKRYTNFYFLLCERLPHAAQDSLTFGATPQLLTVSEWSVMNIMLQRGLAQLSSIDCHHAHKGLILFPVQHLPAANLQSAAQHSKALGWFLGYAPRAWACTPMQFCISMVANWTIAVMATSHEGLVHLPSLSQ